MFYGLHAQRIRTLSTLQNAHSEGREASAPLGLLHCVTRPPERVLARSNLSDKTPFLGFSPPGDELLVLDSPLRDKHHTQNLHQTHHGGGSTHLGARDLYPTYLDDLLVAAPSASLCAAHLMITLEILSNLGWVVNLR